MRYWTEVREFYRQFRQQYFTTGSILPSSRALARALVSQMRRLPKSEGFGSRGGRRILEVGPGTGAITTQILHHLRPDDRLDIVEINADFIALLERRFDEEPDWRIHRNQVRLLHMPLQTVPGERVYDFMISGLPLNNFPVALVREIFGSYQRLLKPVGVLSYFEYLGIRKVKMLLVNRRVRRRLHVLSRMLERLIKAFQVKEQWVFLNVPPAVARHMRFG